MSRNKLNLIGKKSGRLTVIKYVGSQGRYGALWLCKCDCGRMKRVLAAKISSGVAKSCGCLEHPRGELNCHWKGGKYQSKAGYIILSDHNHPNAKHGHIAEHIKMMSEILGRPLFPGETVHHKNGIKNDNKSENLELRLKNHGPGQRINDLVPYWIEMLGRYAPEKLMEVENGPDNPQ